MKALKHGWLPLLAVLCGATPALSQSASGTATGSAGATQERLGISLPDMVGGAFSVRSALDQLTREVCDQKAIFALGAALEKAGYRRESANAHIGFSKTCKGYAPSLRRAINVLLELSDYAAAIGVSTELVALEPLHDNGYFLRAVAHDRGGDAKKAIDDYITATQLYPDKDTIANASYFSMARLHDKLGQPCDAAASIASWVALNPRNDSSQTRTAIAGFAAKGNCRIAKSDGEEVIANAQPGNTVKLSVNVNGVRGTFVLDTGASFVSVRNSFAGKAKIDIDPDSSIQLHTANGITAGKRGRAQAVQLKSLEAKDVAVVVQPDDRATYGNGIDGLLGMSFLSRFDVKIERNAVRISSRKPR
jgi:clan AA aspartic protease (TIGR02281 family)